MNTRASARSPDVANRGPLQSRPMGNAAEWASTAAHDFRAVAKDADDAVTKQLAEGLVYLADAIRDLDAQLETITAKLDGR